MNYLSYIFPKHTLKMVLHYTKIEHINYSLFSFSKNKATNGRDERCWYLIEIFISVYSGKEQTFPGVLRKHIRVFRRSLTLRILKQTKTDYIQKSCHANFVFHIQKGCYFIYYYFIVNITYTSNNNI